MTNITIRWARALVGWELDEGECILNKLEYYKPMSIDEVHHAVIDVALLEEAYENATVVVL